MIAKAGKTSKDSTSYRPFQTLILKLYEQQLLRRIQLIIEKKKIIPDHQFGFRDKHATIGQMHRISYQIVRALEERKSLYRVFEYSTGFW